MVLSNSSIRKWWKISALLSSALILLLTVRSRATEWLSSPDGRIEIYCNINVSNYISGMDIRFYYKIFFDGYLLIQDSPIGLNFIDMLPLDKEFRLYHVERRSISDTIMTINEPYARIINQYNEITLFLQEKTPPFRLINIVFRISNEGVAFRYVIPEQSEIDEFEISAENTIFNFPYNYTAWILPLESFTTPYENNYKTTTINKIDDDTIIGLPLLLKTEHGAWIAITEANLTDYAGMYLCREKSIPFGFRSRLSPHPDNPELKVRGRAPFKSPWRVILIGSTPGDLIESNFIFSLNQPCKIDDTSWIKPGKCVWPWWSGRHVEGVGFEGGMNTETMIHYLDFAAKHGIEYLLIDAGWYGKHNNRDEDITKAIPEIDLQRILQEGKQKGVGIILWLFWQCVEDQMERAFPLYEKWGVAGIKVDYMNRDDQEMVNFYHRVVRKAAQHHLLVDFHGAYKPTGIRRTYPNLITREGVLGLEWNKWSRKCNPDHELTIPFIRMLAGPMDFTPGCFRTFQKNRFNPEAEPPGSMGTRCHQLAMYVVYESPLQMCVDFPASYKNQVGIEFIETVPTVWDSSCVINGMVGDYITIARKHKEEWYIGSMTDWTGRTLKIPLDFLGPGRYTAEIYSDSPKANLYPTNIIVTREYVTKNDTLRAVLGPGGGYVARIFPSDTTKNNL